MTEKHHFKKFANPDFEAWSLFVAVAEAGSFAGAARARDLSVPTVSRTIARLEQRIGSSLFHRTSRRLSLSAIGAQALREAQHLVEMAQQMEEKLCEATEMPSGTICMAAPLDFGREFIAPLLPEFLAEWPGISIELFLDDARIDIVGSGHDIVLRIGNLPDSSLIARRLADVRLIPVASPAYLAAYGSPAHPAELSAHRCLRYLNSPQPSQWHFISARDEAINVQVEGPLSTTSGGVMLPALLAGAGIALLPDFLIWRDLAAGRVRQILPEWQAMVLDVSLLTPPSTLRPARVRLLMDWLSARLQNAPWRAPQAAEATAATAMPAP